MKEVYRLSDLDSREILDQGAHKPAKIAVIGNPVAHSASPVMHQAALDKADINARYIRLQLEQDELPSAILKLKKLGFIGCNVTVPHKLNIIPQCDKLTKDASALNAVNTIILGEQIVGHNTDTGGFINSIKEEFNIEIKELKILIVGVGGGAGRAIATQCARLGCKKLWLVNRTLNKAQELAQKLEETYSFPALALEPTSLDVAQAIQEADLVINATSLGLKGSDPLPLLEEHLSLLGKNQYVYDMIYKPSETPLLKKAREQGSKTSNGLTMLLHQGVLSYQRWFEGSYPLEPMRKGLLSTL